MKPAELDAFLWYPEDMRDGIQVLAVEARLPIREVVLPPVEPSLTWLEQACELLGLELETALGQASELESALRTVAPGMVMLLGDMRSLCVLAAKRNRVTLVSSGQRRQNVRVDQLARLLEARYRPPVGSPAFLRGLPDAERSYVRTVGDQVRDQGPMFAVAPLRVAPSRPLRHEFDQSAFGRRFVGAIALLLAQSLLAIGATLLLGQSAARGRADTGLILGWGLALVTQVAFQGLLGLVVGNLNIELATALKRRLITGALSLQPDFVRQLGVGANLSTAAESATIDQLSVADLTEAASSFFVFVTATVFLVFQDSFAALILGVFVALLVWLLVRFYRQSSAITGLRIKLTDVFIERVLGHQTRLVQLPRARWHEGEDEHLHAYVEATRGLDVTQTMLAILPRAWLVVLALLQLRNLVDVQTRYLMLLPIVAGYATMQALNQLVVNVQRIMRWPVSLKVLWPILSRSLDVDPVHATKLPDGDLADGDVVLEASGLRFAYHPLRPPVLNGLDLTIRAGDQFLVTGPSGGGKSTLTALLTGLRQPTAGLVMLRGLDQHSVSGSEWRRQVISAPQFHENYIFQNSLAFNLLMGRAWPPQPPDLFEAEALCHELGLGPLLESMPAGIQQVVGETGWRLSHGERSRVFIARALLQNADVLIFDESFGSLDPETLELAMQAVRARARTLLVISHK